MIFRRQRIRGVYQRRIIALTADAPFFRRYRPRLPGGPFHQRLLGYFVASDHVPPTSSTAATPFLQTAVTVITG